jgi:hypothetical protein
MRKITQQAIEALERGEYFKLNNTEVEPIYFRDGSPMSVYLRLHGHNIARWTPETGELLITLAGWPTPTTRERLNGLDGVHITQRKGEQYLNGHRWSGRWVNINEWNESI